MVEKKYMVKKLLVVVENGSNCLKIFGERVNLIQDSC